MPILLAATLPRGLLMASSAMVLALLLVPRPALDALESAAPWLAEASEWLGGFAPGHDMEHFAAFALLACLARVAQRRPSFWRAFGPLALFGAATELAQMWSSSRSASLDDLVLNLGGAAAGYAVAAALACGSKRVLGFRPAARAEAASARPAASRSGRLPPSP